jgi:hypothetical protein
MKKINNKIIRRRGFEEKGEEKKGYENANNIYIYIHISKVDTLIFQYDLKIIWHNI